MKHTTQEGSTTAIIIAAGEGYRWNNHLGVPKHFVQIEGEAILERSVRLIRSYCPTVWVVGPDERYRVDGAGLYVPHLEAANFDADKFLSSSSLWNADGRTVVLCGDVYFSKRAVSVIMRFRRREWTAFGRFNPSLRTGGRWPELFAHSFWPEHTGRHLTALQDLVRLCRDGKTHPGNGWQHYRLLNGATDQELRLHRNYGHFVEIDDWTDDFDFPEDYDEYVRRRRSFTYRSKRRLIESPQYWRRRSRRWLRWRFPRVRRAFRAVRPKPTDHKGT